ncbi:MAG: Uncharacterised protein [Flavobacteriia bacterium]|nr:MAG: Uncharacterised protein [Flavobacteriia bacterium]
MRSIALLCLTFFMPPLLAQNDLLAELEGMEEKKVEYVTAAFKGTKIINGQSSEIPGPGVLQFVFQHRFGSLSDDFFYNFLGLDNAQVRLGIDYSFNDWINVGVGRSSFEKTYDGFVKAKLLRQCTGSKNVPLSLTLFTSAFINTLKFRGDLDPDMVNRMSYSTQLVISRKFNSRLSLAATPTLLHVNMVPETQQNNTVLAIGMGGRYKLTQRLSLNLEYFPQLQKNNYSEGSGTSEFYNSLSVGFDIETGGHVFQLFFSNSRGVIDPQFIAESPGSWTDGDVYFGFNISRVFTLKKPDLPTYN